jgi:signal transduction histidine kinase
VTRIEVRDTGLGVPPDLHDKIFERSVRGTQSSLPGLGIGLATVRRLAEAHGGTAGVRPNVPTGSIFWVELPNATARESKRAWWRFLRSVRV